MNFREISEPVVYKDNLNYVKDDPILKKKETKVSQEEKVKQEDKVSQEDKVKQEDLRQVVDEIQLDDDDDDDDDNESVRDEDETDATMSDVSGVSDLDDVMDSGSDSESVDIESVDSSLTTIESVDSETVDIESVDSSQTTIESVDSETVDSEELVKTSVVKDDSKTRVKADDLRHHLLRFSRDIYTAKQLRDEALRERLVAIYSREIDQHILADVVDKTCMSTTLQGFERCLAFIARNAEKLDPYVRVQVAQNGDADDIPAIYLKVLCRKKNAPNGFVIIGANAFGLVIQDIALMLTSPKNLWPYMEKDNDEAKYHSISLMPIDMSDSHFLNHFYQGLQTVNSIDMTEDDYCGIIALEATYDKATANYTSSEVYIVLKIMQQLQVYAAALATLYALAVIRRKKAGASTRIFPNPRCLVMPRSRASSRLAPIHAKARSMRAAQVRYYLQNPYVKPHYVHISSTTIGHIGKHASGVTQTSSVDLEDELSGLRLEPKKVSNKDKSDTISIASSKASTEVSSKVSDKVSSKVSDKKSSSTSSNKASAEVSDQVSNKVSDQVSNKVSNKVLSSTASTNKASESKPTSLKPTSLKPTSQDKDDEFSDADPIEQFISQVKSTTKPLK